jgi:hypothetical protein
MSQSAEIEDAAAIGAEREVGRGDEDDLAAGGAEEGFGGVGHGMFRCYMKLLRFLNAFTSSRDN